MQFIAADVLHIELYNYKICNINTCSIWNNLHKLHSPYPHNIYNYFTFSFPIAVRMSIEQNKKQKHLHTISCSEISMKFEITEWDLHLGDIHQSLHRVSSSFRNRANNSYRNVKSEKKKKKSYPFWVVIFQSTGPFPLYLRLVDSARSFINKTRIWCRSNKQWNVENWKSKENMEWIYTRDGCMTCSSACFFVKREERICNIIQPFFVLVYTPTLAPKISFFCVCG